MPERTIEVPLEAVQTIVDWWRSANEAPGGCSAQEAIDGMRGAVWQLELARRRDEGETDEQRTARLVVEGEDGVGYA